ncbi:MAG: glucans biosynthesis glucosyltransferase MdoH [Opitutales bacterium]|nr:glucans biosynthesis glucosyltransferase MdoH [Opitutales bacterium]
MNYKRISFFISVAVCMALPTYFFADLLWRLGMSPLRVVLLITFSLLTLPIALGFNQFIFGVFARLFSKRYSEPEPNPEKLPERTTAINIPVFNEDAYTVLERLRTVYQDLERAGQIHAFDFYILSDSTSPDNWASEEYGWARICRDLNGFDRIFYRRRKDNAHQKAGNILNFCESWGRRYRYMLVFDADSLMDAETIVRMVRKMEREPKLGILQSIPRLIRATTFFGKMQQFANRFFGVFFSRGYAFWSGNEGNYWGHNAIIRVDPFIQHCALPELPGRAPWGGKILSHDFVEAALMVSAGYSVRIDPELEGSYEEGPQDLLDAAKRDRRWCQGNLQHFWLLFANQLKFVSKLHFIIGIFSYAGALFWALFLTVSIALFVEHDRSDLSLIPLSTTLPFSDFSIARHGLFVFLVLFSMLLLPKLLALLYGLFSSSLRKPFGNRISLIFLTLAELIYSTLIAPVLMVFHARFVLLTIFGQGIGWTSQNRSSSGLSWSECTRSLLLHTFLGAIAFLIAINFGYGLLLWLSPIWLGLLLSTPIAVLSSRPMDSLLARIPRSQSSTIPIVEAFENNLRNSKQSLPMEGRVPIDFASVIIDPYLNAIHISLIVANANSRQADKARTTAESSILQDPPEHIEDATKTAVLENRSLLEELHRKVWLLPDAHLHPAWQKRLLIYGQTQTHAYQ